MRSQAQRRFYAGGSGERELREILAEDVVWTGYPGAISEMLSHPNDRTVLSATGEETLIPLAGHSRQVGVALQRQRGLSHG